MMYLDRTGIYDAVCGLVVTDGLSRFNPTAMLTHDSFEIRFGQPFSTKHDGNGFCMSALNHMALWSKFNIFTPTFFKSGDMIFFCKGTHSTTRMQIARYIMMELPDCTVPVSSSPELLLLFCR